jgi:aspartate kinase
VPIHVRNSAHDREGTWIVAESSQMEHIVVSGAALKKDLIRVTLKSVPDHPGVAAKIFSDIASAKIMVDDIIQNVMDDNTANISFTVEHGDLHDINPVVERLVKDFAGKCSATYQSDLAKVSVVGVGMRTHTGVAERMFHALAEHKINIQNITTSEIKISCIIDKDDANRALQVVHDAFELGKTRE